MRKAELFMVDDSTPVYHLQKVETNLEEEKQRVLSYMNHESDVKVQHVVETEVLAKKETELLEKEGGGCKVLLINVMNEGLSRLCFLFTRIPDGLIPVYEPLERSGQ
jgi:cullin 1